MKRKKRKSVSSPYSSSLCDLRVLLSIVSYWRLLDMIGIFACLFLASACFEDMIDLYTYLSLGDNALMSTARLIGLV